LEPPEPDYAHLPARPFQTKKPVPNANQSSGIGRGKKQSIKESELAPLKAQIDKANAARAFKERFAAGQKGNVLTVGEDGIARRERREKPEEEVAELDDIDSFLAELDLQKGIFTVLDALMNRYRFEYYIDTETYTAKETCTGSTSGLRLVC